MPFEGFATQAWFSFGSIPAVAFILLASQLGIPVASLVAFILASLGAFILASLVAFTLATLLGSPVAFLASLVSLYLSFQISPTLVSLFNILQTIIIMNKLIVGFMMVVITQSQYSSSATCSGVFPSLGNGNSTSIIMSQTCGNIGACCLYDHQCNSGCCGSFGGGCEGPTNTNPAYGQEQCYNSMPYYYPSTWTKYILPSYT